LCLLPGYNAFRGKLAELLSEPVNLTTDDEIVLEVLQTETETEVMVDEAGQPDALVDNALETLVDNATEEFGFAPRDVYSGVVELRRTRRRHAATMKKLNYSMLKTLTEAFSDKLDPNGFTHRVVAIFPVGFLDDDGFADDVWEINFKSNRITREIVELMRLEEDKHLREMYDLFRKIPESSALAGWVFEAIVHRTLSGGRQSELEPIPMVSNRCHPPLFSTDPSSLPSTPGTSLLSPAPLHARTRAVRLVNFTHESSNVMLGNVTLENDIYYVPITANNPLFDSFTIDHNLDRGTVVIYFFQITTSSTHGGSAKGYPNIRKIMARVHGLLNEKDLNATVKVAYFLVCPDDRSKRQWQMPVGWGDGVAGDAFCICIPSSVPLSTPGKEAKAELKKRTSRKRKVKYCYFKPTTVRVSHKRDRG